MGCGCGVVGRVRSLLQPALFAVEVALVAVLAVSGGWSPDFVMGHSVGELTAAYVAGVLSLADAAVLVAARGRLMAGLPAGGVMVAVAAGEAEVAPLLGAGVGLRRSMGRGRWWCRGSEAAVEAVAERLAGRGRRVQRLAVSHAFHSALMEPMLEEFAAVRWRDRAAVGRGLAVVSNVTGELAGPEFGSAQYWVEHVRQPVRFADGVRCLPGRGVTRVRGGGSGCGVDRAAIEASAAAARWWWCRVGWVRIARRWAVWWVRRGSCVCAGVGVDWASVFAGSGGRRVELPTYAFERQRFWLTAGWVG